MAVNVTYLLGAGASYETLPLVKEVKIENRVVKHSFGHEIISLAKRYKSLTEKVITKLSDQDKVMLDKVVKSLQFLGENSKKFSSPDTFIKSLSLQGKHDKIEIAKKGLSIFLTITQLLNNKPDSRYIPFLASILETIKSKIQIPENINIISWNYDFQLELALNNFQPNNFPNILNHFKIIPNIQSDISGARVVHLNGVAGLMKKGDSSIETMFREIKDITDQDELLIEFLHVFGILDQRYTIHDLLTFAWELNEVSHERIQMARKILTGTKILIIIGYSFPFFNREIDNQLIKSFIANNEINEKHDLKIYIQNPSISKNQIEFLRQRFGIDDEIEIEALQDTDQFFLPPEL